MTSVHGSIRKAFTSGKVSLHSPSVNDIGRQRISGSIFLMCHIMKVDGSIPHLAF